MRAARVPVEKGHVSLHVFHLALPERRRDAVAMMREVAAEFVAAEESASCLRLRGVRAFPGSRDDALLELSGCQSPFVSLGC